MSCALILSVSSHPTKPTHCGHCHYVPKPRQVPKNTTPRTHQHQISEEREREEASLLPSFVPSENNITSFYKLFICDSICLHFFISPVIISYLYFLYSQPVLDKKKTTGYVKVRELPLVPVKVPIQVPVPGRFPTVCPQSSRSCCLLLLTRRDRSSLSPPSANERHHPHTISPPCKIANSLSQLWSWTCISFLFAFLLPLLVSLLPRTTRPPSEPNSTAIPSPLTPSIRLICCSHASNTKIPPPPTHPLYPPISHPPAPILPPRISSKLL